jgi:hypothetical protein
MSTGITKTGYSSTFGGAVGYLNIGGWNTTLTDVANTAKETIGVKRREGANEYMYVQLGTSTACNKAFLSLSTGLTDTNTICAPFGLTANGTASTGQICLGRTIISSPTSGVCYAWVLIEGFATGNAATDTALNWGSYVMPSTSTANLVDTDGTTLTCVGRVVFTSVATAVASAAGAGNMIYWKFKSLGGIYNN